MIEEYWGIERVFPQPEEEPEVEEEELHTNAENVRDAVTGDL